MIRNKKFYAMSRGRIDETGYELRRQLSPAVLNADVPERIDIALSHVNIYYKGSDFSYARPYSFERAYPVRVVEEKKREVIQSGVFRFRFNNPHNKEKEMCCVVCLIKGENAVFLAYRVARWLRSKENLLWMTNIIILIVNIILLISK